MKNSISVISSLNSSVRKALTDIELIGGKRLVVAVSGGADSLALLTSLNCLRDELDLHLHGAHLDHGLRADSARADAQFVKATFRKLEIDLTCEQADVATFREDNRLSLEEAARNVRYAFLGRIASDVNADAILLGHTADDQAETILINIIRGTGLTELRKIKKFYNSVQINLHKTESIKQGTDIIGSRVRARVVKNKVAPPFRVAEFDIMFNAGISKEGDLIDLGNSMGIVKKNGSFYSHNDTRLGQGRENAKTFLKDNKSIAELIESSIRKKEDTET